MVCTLWTRHSAEPALMKAVMFREEIGLTVRPLKDSGLADKNTRWTNFWCGLFCHLDFGGACPSPPCTDMQRAVSHLAASLPEDQCWHNSLLLPAFHRNIP